MGHIYCFTNQINNKKYIGLSINDKNIRYNLHKSSYLNKNDKEYNSLLHKKFRQYGFDNFTYEILVDNIEDINLLNELEIYYINYYHTWIKDPMCKGYNIEPGGRNCSKPKTPEQKVKLTWGQTKLTEDEIKELRIAYKEGKSPTQIYNEKYSDRLHYNSFLNIWSGRRYKNIYPEYIQNGRHTKMNLSIADKIRQEYASKKISFQKLADEYNCSKSTIADIIHLRTWKTKE